MLVATSTSGGLDVNGFESGRKKAALLARLAAQRLSPCRSDDLRVVSLLHLTRLATGEPRSLA